jgi:CelD/BcsL family acetyltransferase involved in cellulose biosynthesis
LNTQPPQIQKKKNRMPGATVATYTVAPESLDDYAAWWPPTEESVVWPNPFVLPPWLTAWWPSFAGIQTPYLLSIRAKERLVGLAPLMRRGPEARLMGDNDLCDHLDFIVAPQRAQAFYLHLLDHLAADGIRRLVLPSVREDASATTALLPVARQWGARVQCERQAQLFAMDLPGSWEAYLEGLRGKERHEIRRKLRRLEEAGRINLRCVRSAAALPAAMETFIHLFKINRAAKADFMTGSMPAFFRRLAEKMAAAGLLRLYFLELDDVAIAAVMCFDHGSTVYLYNNGYDAAYRRLSPGLLCKVLTIRQSIRDGRHIYDFLKGSEKYKQHLGGRPVNLLRCEIEWDSKRINT